MARMTTSYLQEPQAGLVPWGRDYGTLIDRFGERAAVVTPAGSCSFAELVGRAAGVAARLKEAAVAPGEPVATFLRNSREAVWAGYGVTLAGACETALNANLSPDEIAYCVGLAGVRHAITDAESAPLFASLGVTAHVVEEIGPAALDRTWHAPDIAWGKILFTSGTTGRPKAIVHSHGRRWLANILQRAHLPFVPEARSRVLLMTPFTHGASLITYAWLDHGATIHLTDGVDVETVRDLLDRREIDAMFAPPTVLAKILQSLAGRDYTGVLRAIFTGTATLTPALYRTARAMFGPIVRVTYGKSEIVNPITILPPDATDAFYAANAEAAAANLGWPAAGVEVAIRDETGRDCPTGEAGEIHLRSPHMLVGHIDASGYHPLPPEGWHATGDIGHLDAAGALHLAGRAGDVIKSGGYKIYPQEIELALAETNEGRPIVAVGLPSAYWGEVIVAVAEAAPPDWPERAAAAAVSLTRFKQPRAYLTLEALPRVGQDKISRRRTAECLDVRFRLEDGPRPRLILR
jgi:acyl-CoA synthetase (AMP-forming)/AMP-acid ligase II